MASGLGSASSSTSPVASNPASGAASQRSRQSARDGVHADATQDGERKVRQQREPRHDANRPEHGHVLEQQQVRKLVLADDLMLLPMRSEREQHRDHGQRQEQTADSSQLTALVGPSQHPGHRANAGQERRHEAGEYPSLAARHWKPFHQRAVPLQAPIRRQVVAQLYRPTLNFRDIAVRPPGVGKAQVPVHDGSEGNAGDDPGGKHGQAQTCVSRGHDPVNGRRHDERRVNHGGDHAQMHGRGELHPDHQRRQPKVQPPAAAPQADTEQQHQRQVPRAQELKVIRIGQLQGPKGVHRAGQQGPGTRAGQDQNGRVHSARIESEGRNVRDAVGQHRALSDPGQRAVDGQKPEQQVGPEQRPARPEVEVADEEFAGLAEQSRAAPLEDAEQEELVAAGFVRDMRAGNQQQRVRKHQRGGHVEQRRNRMPPASIVNPPRGSRSQPTPRR